MGMGVFMPDKGNILERGALYLGVYKNSPNKKAAFRFIDLMLSEPLQNMIVTMLWDSTCLKKSAKLFSKLFENTNDQYITEYLKRSPIVSDVQNHDYMQKQHFMIHDLRDILYALMNGKLKSEQAAKIAVKRWKKLKKH
jgi:ABC-type glycerol-3-phosphate transport system substrate-binding protein